MPWWHKVEIKVQLYFFFNLCARWGWVINATPRPLYTPGKIRYPLYRGLSGHLGRSGGAWKISPAPGFDPRDVQPAESRYTDYASITSCHMFLRLLQVT
jgi:hypothetical protein